MALEPFDARRAELRETIRSIDASGDTSDAVGAVRQRLENEQLMLDIDQQTMLPPHLTASGEFEAGDFRSYYESMGFGSFDDLSPEAQFNFIRSEGPAYLMERQGEAALAAGEAALPGAGGEVLGQAMAMGVIRPWRGPPRARRASGRSCTTCNEQHATPREPFVTLYRGIQVRRDEPVDPTYQNAGSRGQMASTSAGDALHYGINPAGASRPGADELVLIRMHVPRRLIDGRRIYDPSPGAPRNANESLHLVIDPQQVNIRTLPGYRELRVPLREVAGPPGPNGQREQHPAAVSYWTRRLEAGAPGAGHNGGPPLDP